MTRYRFSFPIYIRQVKVASTKDVSIWEFFSNGNDVTAQIRLVRCIMFWGSVHTNQ